MSKRSVHKDPNTKNAREASKRGGMPMSEAERTRNLVRGRLEPRLEGVDELDAPGLIAEVATALARDLSKQPELTKIHLYALVHNYVASTLYSMLSDERPGLGEWSGVLADEDGEGGWFEHSAGVYRRVTGLKREQLLAVADERERRIMGQQEAVQELRRAADEMEDDETMITLRKLPGVVLEEEPMSQADLQNALTDVALHEYTGFCWYDGTILLDAEVVDDYHHLPPRMAYDNATGEEVGMIGAGAKKCPTCQTVWYRANYNDCPQDGNPFVHLGMPSRVEVAGDRVLAATGVCYCDNCFYPMLYSWSRVWVKSVEEFMELTPDHAPLVKQVRSGQASAIHIEPHISVCALGPWPKKFETAEHRIDADS